MLSLGELYPFAVQPQQVEFDSQQCWMDIPATTIYLQPYAHPHREVINHADCLRVSHQMGVLNQFLANSDSSLTHQQICDNAIGANSKEDIPSNNRNCLIPKGF